MDTLGAALPGTDAEPQLSLSFGATGLAFSPDGELVAVAGGDGVIWILDVESREPLRALSGHAGQVRAVGFDATGRQLATAGDDGTVRLWDPTNGQELHTLQGHQSTVLGVAFSPNSQQLASAGNDGTARLWDPRQGTWLATLAPFAEGWAVLMPDGRYKLEGVTGSELWWVAGLCRFEPGELDPYVPSIRRLPADAPLFPPST